MGLKEAIFGGGARPYEQRAAYHGSVQEWLPVQDIIQGTVVTKDGRFVRILEITPLNFYTLSDSEKDAVLADFQAYLKISPSTLQVTVRTQRFKTDDYTERMKKRLDTEPVEACRLMIEDNIKEVARITSTEAITHRFFLSFEYEPSMKAKDNSVEAIAERMNDVADMTRRYLDRCGLEVIEPEYSDNAVLELLYEILNKTTSCRVRLPAGVFDMVSTVHGVYGKEEQAIHEAEKKNQNEAKRHGLKKKGRGAVSRLEAGATSIADIIAPTDLDLTMGWRS